MIAFFKTVFASFYFKVFIYTTLSVCGILVLRGLYYKAKIFAIGRLVYERSFSHTGQYCGEYVTLTETIYNPTFFPLFFIDVEYYLYGALYLENEYSHNVKPDSMIYCISRFNLIPFMKVRREHKILCQKRGEYNLESVVIYVKKTPRYIQSPAKLLIYPKYIEYKDVPYATVMLQGAEESKKRLLCDPFMISGVREYRHGDPLSMINFKATARRPVYDLSDIMVNNLNYSSSRRILVIINFQVAFGKKIPFPTYQNMMERGLSYAASILTEATKNGYLNSFRGNFVLQNGRPFSSFPFESGSLHLDNILNVMAGISMRDETSIYFLLDKIISENITETEIIFITPDIDDEIYDKLYLLEKNRNFLTVLPLNEEAMENEKD